MFCHMNGASWTATIRFLVVLGFCCTMGCQKGSDVPKADEAGQTASNSNSGPSSKSPAKSDQPERKVDKAFQVPDGSSTEILEFIRGLGKNRPKFKTQKELAAYAVKLNKAMIEAADKILTQESDDDTLKEALTRKLIGTIGMAANGGEQTAEKVLTEVDRLSKDSRPIVSETAKGFRVPARALNLKKLSATERQELADEALDLVRQSKASQQTVGDTSFVADQFLKIRDTASAAKLFDQLADAITESTEEPQMLEFVPQLRGKANKINLPGSQLKIDGPLLGGGELDWDSYRGKVVLVDYWATWCGPCVAEIPNVLANYRKYHDQGFEVVGISLDQDRKALEKFLESEKLPWVQLFQSEDKSKMGGQHPMAIRYGVTSIPAAFLVDREGKVVSTNARGAELEIELNRLLGTQK